MNRPAEFKFSDQLDHLKALTIRLGSIHEAQALQIRNYPLLIPGVVSAAAHVDTEKKIVLYKCKKNNKFKNDAEVQTACGNINVFIKRILWDETTVTIQVGGAVIYDSRSK